MADLDGAHAMALKFLAEGLWPDAVLLGRKYGLTPYAAEAMIELASRQFAGDVKPSSRTNGASAEIAAREKADREAAQIPRTVMRVTGSKRGRKR